MLLWRVISIRAQFIRHVEWKSVSDLEQELIYLPHGLQFIPARCPILLDEDSFTPAFFSASSSFFQFVVPTAKHREFLVILTLVCIRARC